jgi:uncharacterized membrane protein
MSELLRAQDRPLRVRKVHSQRTFLWLARGWSDFMESPLVGLLHGLLMGVFGGGLLLLAWDHFWVLAGALSGFLMVAPILSTGLYAVSRALLRGEPAGFGAVWAVWSSMDSRLITLGIKPPVSTPTDFLHRVVLAPNPGFFEIWLLVGGAMAAPVFASSVVAIPLLVDRKVSVQCAVLTSWRAVTANPICLSTWAAIVMSLSLLGLGTLMFGLILVFPVLGHATWHAYRDLVVRETV